MKRGTLSLSISDVRRISIVGNPPLSIPPWRDGLRRTLPFGRQASRPSFTLIELLVVIAIISVLAAMLLPALKKAQDSSKSAVCANNLHQIGVMILLYVNENEDWMVKGRTPSILNYGMWFDQLMIDGIMQQGLQFKRGSILTCPASKYQNLVNDFDFSNYTYNNYLGNALVGFPRVRYADITRPSSIMIMFDGAYRRDEPGPPPFSQIWYSGGWPTIIDHVNEGKPPIHGNGLNVLFADGHVGHILYNDPNAALSPGAVPQTSYWHQHGGVDVNNPPFFP
ncbi:MAG: prepilin-type N-terminal cleavage/methylation domain-containing protein [Verrucomicrobia bacterium]|nr:prepilin-type N-terminal cleavage/methylation domain-containing protein [Verrucomicrobiota bacterium]